VPRQSSEQISVDSPAGRWLRESLVVTFCLHPEKDSDSSGISAGIFKRQVYNAVLRQNSMRTENSAIPCRDGWLIQVIPSPSNAKNLSREPARYTCIYKDGGTRTFSRRCVGSD
jgi:hypothetical protein